MNKEGRPTLGAPGFSILAPGMPTVSLWSESRAWIQEVWLRSVSDHPAVHVGGEL